MSLLFSSRALFSFSHQKLLAIVFDNLYDTGICRILFFLRLAQKLRLWTTYDTCVFLKTCFFISSCSIYLDSPLWKLCDLHEIALVSYLQIVFVIVSSDDLSLHWILRFLRLVFGDVNMFRDLSGSLIGGILPSGISFCRRLQYLYVSSYTFIFSPYKDFWWMYVLMIAC